MLDRHRVSKPDIFENGPGTSLSTDTSILSKSNAVNPQSVQILIDASPDEDDEYVNAHSPDSPADIFRLSAADDQAASTRSIHSTDLNEDASDIGAESTPRQVSPICKIEIIRQYEVAHIALVVNVKKGS